MDKTIKKRLVVYGTLITMLITSKFVIDKSASSMNKSIINFSLSQEEDINLVAHRGLSSLYPDNSLEGINACKDLKCIEGVEVDVRLSKDNKLVLIHNDFIGLNRVSDYTYEELCNMDLRNSLISRMKLFKGYNLKEQLLLSTRREILNSRSYSLCTLEDILKTRDKSKLLFIDIKFTGYNDDLLIYQIGELIKGEDNIVLQSFDDALLRKMKELYPDYYYQLLIENRSVLGDIDYIYDAYGIKYTIVNEDIAKEILNRGKSISLWTVNSYKDFNELKEEYEEYNDDIYYISDNPDIIGYQYSKSLKNS